MCGIVGLADPTQPVNSIEQTLRRMNSRIVHRGPDDEGNVARHGIGIGMRRLSIMDVSGGQQPISNEAGDIHVVCNGEIYNFDVLRSELQIRGHRFATRSDAEVIVHLYEETGTDCFQQLRGMYGIAILDERNDRIVVARDRLGQKPLFYSELGGAFIFGSEMKSLLAVRPELAEPDLSVLGHYLQFAYIPEPTTIYRQIRRLPAGCFGVWESGHFTQHCYWDFEVNPSEQTSEQEWVERIDAKIEEAVRIRLQSEVPLGVFLSGGLDSSAIVHYAHQAGLKPLKTFTIGFDRKEWDESEDAKRVADHFGTEHHVLTLSEGLLRDSFEATLDQIIWHCDEPFGDASAIPTHHVSRMAREHVTVILSGDGGDELFAGYSSYQGAMFALNYRRRLPNWFGGRFLPAAAGMGATLFPGGARYKMKRIAKILRDSALPIQQAYRDKSSIWNVHQLSELLTNDGFEQCDYLGEQYMPDRMWQIFQQAASSADPYDLVSGLSEIDIRSYMRDDILVKVDRMSMANSLEVRSPLLDHELAELAARIPAKHKIQGRSGKHVLRKVLEGKLPPKSTRKAKQGFSVPLRDWFRGDLRTLVHDRLLSEDALPPGIFNEHTIRRTLLEHDRGQVDHANRIWLLLTIATWHGQQQAATAVDQREQVDFPRSRLGQEAISCES
ncbi:MAG: asparagine synthase (glutamine-hydrolyzing) [Planctomycetota bacterium]